MYPSSQPQQSPSQKPQTLRRAILTIGIILVAIGLGLQVYRVANAPTCLTAEDYVAFYSSNPTDATFGPGTEFFSNAYRFTSDTSDVLVADSTTSPTDDAKKIADFYEKNPKKQVALTISTAYASSTLDGKSIAEKRLTAIKKILTDAGLSSELIKTSSEAYDVSDDATELDDINNVVVSFSSAESCRE